MKKFPHLSIVATSRNDGHGGDMLKRMKLFVQGLIGQSRRHRLPVELILVEWNPPPDRPRLREILPQPTPGDLLILRYIEVPPEIHQRYKRAREIPLFQMIAKNVGIRRATGDFILCTNVDLLYSNPLFQRLATGKLRKDTYYRANRCDVPDGLDLQWDIEEQLAWCQRNVIRRLGRDARFKNVNLEPFGLNDNPWIKKWLFDKWAILAKAFWTPEKRQYFQIDTFACGDFTLMSREAWMAIRGYAELDLYSIHIDSLALLTAAALGYRQEVFPPHVCTYHIDHPQGWERLSPFQKIRWLEERPGLDYSMLFEAGLFVLKNKEPMDLNPEHWGFVDHSFEEFIFP